jgi:hypothetical protein
MHKFGKLKPKRSLEHPALSNYMKASAVPFPQVHAWERPIDYGMLGNDTVGDCTVAAAYHMIANWEEVVDGDAYLFTTQQALATYSEITGYNPIDPSTDQGANESDILDYWTNTGIDGHAIIGRATLDVQNIDHVKAAIYTFGGIYIGFQVPQSIADSPDFKHWRLLPTDSLSGSGHAVCNLGYGRAGTTCVSWGALYTMTWDFWQAYVDEAYALVSRDWLDSRGQSPAGLDLQGLLADLQQV